MAAPSKNEQDSEAAARVARQGVITPSDPVPEVAAETTRQEADVTPQQARQAEPAPVPEAPKPPPVRGPHDNKRADIVSRYRTERLAEKDAEAADDEAELRAFSREGMPPELQHLEPEPPAPAVEPEPSVEPDPIAEPEAPPPKYKLTVRGKEIEVTEEELRAHAQKSLAADTYLEDTKARLNEANELLRQTRDRIQRTDPVRTHPAGQESAQTAVTEPTDGSVPEQPENPYARVVHELQYGDPAVAEKSLEQVIEAAAARKAKESLERTRMADEAARANKLASDFEQENAELAKDRHATAVIKQLLFDMQRDDIRALGIDLALLPDQSDDGISKAHLWYRTQGFRVRDVPKLLTEAKDTYVKWKGGEPKPAAAAATTNKPRVEVSVNRAERRAVIQQQPARTVTPKVETPAAPEARDRSSVVDQMRRDRGRPRGQVTVN
jgi:hypothetical protein